MGHLSRPHLPDGSRRAFYDRLHELHQDAGRPSMRTIQRRTRTAQQPNGINPTTIHDAFASPRLARWETVRAIVVELGGDPDEFARLWRAARDSEPHPDEPPTSDGTRSDGLADRGPVGRPPVVPRQLPADVYAFTGRSDHLAELDGLLARRSTAVVIGAVSGTAGVGKTALAVHWGHRVSDGFPDGQLYADLRGYDPGEPMPPAEALAAFLRSLGVDNADIPVDLTERSARFRSLVAGRRMLLLLDNAHSAEQVRPLLPGTSSCFVVVTSRDDLAGLVVRDGAHRLRLDVLAERESVVLLRTLIGERVGAAPDAASDLADRCARLPLALRIAAELAVGRPDASLADLVAEVADEGRRIEVLAAGADGRTSVRAVFSWSYRHLPPSAARAFRLVGTCPGRDVPVESAAVLLGAPVDVARRELGLLTRAHLVQLTGAGRYSMHDLLRAYARELADGEEPGPDRRAALDRLFAHDLSCVGAANRVMFAEQRSVAEPAGVTFVDAARARAWLDAERSNLVAAVGHMAEHGWPERSLLLAAALWRYLDGCAHYGDAFTVNTFALGAARLIGDRVAEGGALHNLGRVYWLWGRSDEACAHLVEALGIRRETGDRSGEGRTLGSLGTLHWRWGHYDEALGYYRQALAIRREVGDRAGEAIALGNLGIVYEAQGRYDEALDQYHAAIAIHDEVGDAEGRGRTLSNIGVVHQGRGEYDKAVEFHERALATAREVGDRLCELTVLGNLGIVFARWGRHDDALEHYERALRIARDIGDREGEAEIENNAAIVHRERGDGPAAIEHHRRGLTIAREIGDRRTEASCLNGLGEALRACGQWAESAATHREALGLAKDIGDRFQQGRALDGQAHERDASGDHSRAHQLWTAALELYTELGVPEADEVRRLCHAASTP